MDQHLLRKYSWGHSLKGDVDLMHYNCQSANDLKKLYDMSMKPRWKTTLLNYLVSNFIEDDVFPYNKETST